jgi:dihydrofolate synthase/folylpolyglutamate synthase
MAPLPADADAVVRQVAAERGARVVRADEGARMDARMQDGRAVIEFATPAHRYRPVALALRGEHQVENALVTVRLLEEARAAGMAVGFEAIECGLADAVWPARLEQIDLPGGRTLLLDAAHNADGAAALARYLARWHPERPPLVFAAMRDKDVRAILEALLPVTGAVVTTAPSTHRAADPDALAAEVRGIDPGRTVAAESDPLRAVHRAFAGARLVCVAGSIFLAGEVRGGFHGRAILP